MNTLTKNLLWMLEFELDWTLNDVWPTPVLRCELSKVTKKAKLLFFGNFYMSYCFSIIRHFLLPSNITHFYSTTSFLSFNAFLTINTLYNTHSEWVSEWVGGVPMNCLMGALTLNPTNPGSPSVPRLPVLPWGKGVWQITLARYTHRYSNSLGDLWHRIVPEGPSDHHVHLSHCNLWFPHPLTSLVVPAQKHLIIHLKSEQGRGCNFAW